MIESQLQIQGFENRVIPCTLVEPDNANSHLTIILPGAGYNCYRPLLYYATEDMLTKGSRVLQVHTDYTRQEKYMTQFKNRDAVALETWAREDAHRISRFLKDNFDNQMTIMGKSIGTFAMTEIVPEYKFQNLLWLTPSLRGQWNMLANLGSNSHVVIGTKDQFYADAEPFLQRQALVIKDADHALEIPGNPGASIETLGSVIEFIERNVSI